MGNDTGLKAIVEKAELAVVTDDEIQEGVGGNVAEVCDKVMQFEITSAKDFEWAGSQLQQVKRVLKEVDAFFEPMRLATYAAYQAVMSRKKGFTEPLSLAENYLRDIVGEYSKQKLREREIAEKAAREKAYKEAEEKRLVEVEAALERKDEDEAETLMQAPVTVKASEVEAVIDEIPETEGISFREVWSGDLIGATEKERDESMRELCRAIADKQAPVGLVLVNTKVLNGLAKHLKAELNYPGVSAIMRKTPVVRG